MVKAIEYQVPELKTIWEQYDILWMRGLGGYVRLGDQNICRITLRKTNVDKQWTDKEFRILDEKGQNTGNYDREKFNAYEEAFEHHYYGYEFRIHSLITGEKVSGFFTTWDNELNCNTLLWDEMPDIADMLKSAVRWYSWIEVWCK